MTLVNADSRTIVQMSSDICDLGDERAVCYMQISQCKLISNVACNFCSPSRRKMTKTRHQRKRTVNDARCVDA